MKARPTISERVLSAAGLVLLVLMVLEPARGQFNSGIEGTVVDQSGAVLPNAEIVITNEETRVTRQTRSGQSGDFRITALDEGLYRVEVKAEGFKTWIQTGLRLGSNQVRTISPALVLGAKNTTVEVSASLVAIETANSTTSRQIDVETIKSAPLLGRNIYSGVAGLAPGISGSGAFGGGATGSGSLGNDSFASEPGFQINSAGQRQEANEYQVDGSSVNGNSRDGIANITPEPDVVEAMRVTAATFAADKGRESGALIQVFTKSGTNRFHGSVAEFHSNNDLTSRTVFQTAVPVFHRNEFGGTIGGPVRKDKTFFFASFFDLRSSLASTSLATVETPQFRSSVRTNFPNSVAAAFFSAAPPAIEATTNIVSVGQYKNTQRGSYPPPAAISDTLPAVGTAFINQSVSRNGISINARIDDNFHADRDRIFFEFFKITSQQQNPDTRPLFRVVVPNQDLFGKLNWTHTLSPTMLNEASFTGVRAAGDNPGLVSHQELPNVNITGLSGFNQNPLFWAHDNFNWNNILSWTRGKHNLRLGTDIDRQRSVGARTRAFARPSFNFSNLLDFAQDLPFSQAGPAFDVAKRARATNLDQNILILYVGPFVQDDIKVARNFTLNAGLRYDYFGHVATESNGGKPVPEFTLGSGSAFAQQVASGTMEVRGGKGFITSNALSGFAPRIGFGWDMFGDGKTALRGGYGVYYSRIGNLSYTTNNRTNPPVYALLDLSLPKGSTFSYALGDSAGFFPTPPNISFQVNSAGGLVGVPVSTAGMEGISDTPMTQNWMVSVQRRIGRDVLVEADYNGSHSDNLYTQTDVNRFPGDLLINHGKLKRLNPNFGTIIFGRTVGKASSHYGTVMVGKWFSQSWSLRGILTFGKAIDFVSSNDNGVANGQRIINAQDITAQRGLADYDVAKRFALDSVLDIPVPWKTGPASKVLGGWRMSTIAILQSGQPFTVFTSRSFKLGGDFNADGFNFDVPNTPSFGNSISASRSDYIRGLFKASDFPLPPLGTEGNLGRNTFFGPGLANVNTEFAKVVRIPWFAAEGASLEIRADVFNLFNRVNLTQSVSDLASPLFGRSTSQNLTRSTQLGLHISF